MLVKDDSLQEEKTSRSEGVSVAHTLCRGVRNPLERK